MNRDTFLYRAYDAAGELLYVGITNNPTRRYREHGTQSTWASEIVRVRMAGPFTRDVAAALERRALATEEPRFGETPARRAMRAQKAAACTQLYKQLVGQGLDMTTAVRQAVAAIHDQDAA